MEKYKNEVPITSNEISVEVNGKKYTLPAGSALGDALKVSRAPYISGTAVGILKETAKGKDRNTHRIRHQYSQRRIQDRNKKYLNRLQENYGLNTLKSTKGNLSIGQALKLWLSGLLKPKSNLRVRQGALKRLR